MKEYKSVTNKSQREALLNEFKGNLFEYMVGHALARHYQIESEFIKSFGGEIFAELTDYESWIRINEPLLLRKLPVLTQEVMKTLVKSLPASAQQILIAGKNLASNKDSEFAEADIIIGLSGGDYLPLSIKLCKAHAFVNTKSGGVKSFLSKYFSGFSRTGFWQQKINSDLEFHFLKMGQSLYEHFELEFYDRFDKRWTEDLAMSELPGELPKELRSIVHESYYPLSKNLYQALTEFLAEDREKFLSCLLPLQGLSNSKIIQVTCYHSGTTVRPYEFESVTVLSSASKSFDIKKISFKEFNEQTSSFELALDQRLFQIRVKPMNKFTQMSFKINCSVRG